MAGNYPEGVTQSHIDALSAPAGRDGVDLYWQPRCRCDEPCQDCGAEGTVASCEACSGNGYVQIPGETDDVPCSAGCVDGQIECVTCDGTGGVRACCCRECVG